MCKEGIDSLSQSLQTANGINAAMTRAYERVSVFSDSPTTGSIRRVSTEANVILPLGITEKVLNLKYLALQ